MGLSQAAKTLSIFAPAKLNLYLHITGRLDNGYHLVDSLIGFVDIGDQIKIEPATDFELQIEGPFACTFNAKEKDSSPHSANIVAQAAWLFAQYAKKVPNIKVTLTKNLPLAAGIGGGSTDAGALIWGLMEIWGIPPSTHYLPELLKTLGADVPVCLHCEPARVRGIGDIIEPAPAMPEIPIVLINPGKPCPTGNVFRLYDKKFRNEVTLPKSFDSLTALVGFLYEQGNELEDSAKETVPEIANVLHALSVQSGCMLARLTGAGATCFGLFETQETAQAATRTIREENPDWWVETGFLNRPQRY